MNLPALSSEPSPPKNPMLTVIKALHSTLNPTEGLSPPFRLL